MNKTSGKKLSEKEIKWGLTAILAIIIWGLFFFGLNVLPGDSGMVLALAAWVAFIYFGWKFTFSMKLFAAGAFLNPTATSWRERFELGIFVTLIGFVIKFILAMVIGVVVTPYQIAQMLTPKAAAWLEHRDELKREG